MATRTSARPRGLAALAAAGALAGVVLLSGCTDSGEGEGAPTTGATSPVTVSATSEAPTPTASATETSALPPLPDAAKENTPEGAEAFIRYYFDVANDLYQDPPAVDQIDSIVDDSLVDPECISCQTLRTELTQLAQNGQRTLGDLYIVDSIERVGGGPPDVQRFNMTMTRLDYVIESETGQRYEYEGARVSGVGAAIWTGSQWVVYGMELA